MFKSIFSINKRVDIKKMFVELNNDHFGGIIKDIPVIWNDKLRTCAGQCHYTKSSMTPTKITLSSKLFTKNWDLKKIKRTLIHEMVHAYLIQEFNEPGHTQKFQDIMTDITGENINHRCHNYDVEELRNKKLVRYWCPCGLTTGERSRMPKKGLVYKARCCKGTVTFSRAQK